MSDLLHPKLLAWPGVEFRSYFGGVFLVRGRMFAWVGDKGGFVLKLPPERYAEALTLPGATPVETRPGIPFGKWARFPLDEADPGELLGWARAAYDHVLAKPPPRRRSRTRPLTHRPF